MNKLLKTTNRWIAKSKLHWYDFSKLYLWSKQSKLRAVWALPLGLGIIFPIRLLFAVVMTIAEIAEILLEKIVIEYVKLIPNPEAESASVRIARQEYIQQLKDQYIEPRASNNTNRKET